MKKLISILLASVMTASLASCTIEKVEEKPEGGSDIIEEVEDLPEAEDINEPTENEGATISPLPKTVDLDNCDNCTLAISLEEGNVYVDEDGEMNMRVTVYTYDLYDMIDIAGLKEGDKFIRNGEAVEVASVERNELGLISINGGEENGGFDLFTEENTVYYEAGFNDVKAYYAVGEVVIPVSTEFVYTDSSSLDTEPKKFYSSDFLAKTEDLLYDFEPQSTSIVVADGYIVEMHKRYTP